MEYTPLQRAGQLWESGINVVSEGVFDLVDK